MLNIIMFSGMSECGKSHASKFLKENNFHHQKIIFFEKLVMQELKINPNSKDYDPFTTLYENDHDYVFQLFEQQMVNYCLKHKIQNIVLDSTTRVDMVQYFKKSKHNYLSIYIETEFNKRVEREFLKLNKATSLEVVAKNTKTKDQVKLNRKVNLVKDESLIITNNDSVELFEAKILKIVQDFLVNKM